MLLQHNRLYMMSIAAQYRPHQPKHTITDQMITCEDLWVVVTESQRANRHDLHTFILEDPCYLQTSQLHLQSGCCIRRADNITWV